MKKALKIAGSILFYGLLVLVIVSAFLFSYSTDEKKSIFGYRFYEVLSGSMRPTIDIGELVVIKMCNPEDVQVGDIVTKSVSTDGSLTLTHRVIEKYDDPETGALMVVTQGDDNQSADVAMPADEVIGTMQMHIPYLGYVVGFVKGNLLFVVFFALALAVLFTALRIIFGKKAHTPTPEMMEERAYALEQEADDLRQKACDLRKQQDIDATMIDQKSRPKTLSPSRGTRAPQTSTRPSRATTTIRQRQDIAEPVDTRVNPPPLRGEREKGEQDTWLVVPVE